MVNTMPNPIKPHYIAYFDILGYKDFFDHQPEKVEGFLASIHRAVHYAIGYIQKFHESPIMSQIANTDYKIKIFSDNFLICLETTEMMNESVRLLTLIQSIAEIQSMLISEYGLFVRGVITKGDISFNDDYVFGQGLIDAVYLEGKVAKYPRIIVSEELVKYLMENHLYTQEETNKALDIEQRSKNGENISQEDREFYFQMRNQAIMQSFILQGANTLLFKWPDENWIVSYLQRVNVTEMLGTDILNSLLQAIQTVSPTDYQMISTQSKGLDTLLEQHKMRVEEQLIKFGNNKDIEIKDFAKADEREYVLRKYIWSMTYHNLVCDAYKKTQYKILTECNCDVRFIKTIIKVQNDEHKE